MRKRFTNSLMGIVCCFFLLMTACGGGGSSSSGPAPLPPAINVSSDNVSFGNVILDNYSDNNITVQNTGGSDLNIGQIAQANPLASPFSIANDLCSGKTLKASQTCTFQVRFSPSPAHQGNGLVDTFDIPSNDNSVTVNLSGNGKALRVSINQVNTDNCPNLELSIEVSDYTGSPKNGLVIGNFSLSENGVPISIDNVSEVISQDPETVALVLDVSGSMSGWLPDVKDGSGSFIALMNPGDTASVTTFAADIQLEQSFTDNQTALIAAIGDISLRPEFGSLVYDALQGAIDSIVAQMNNRAVILVSDGIDTGTGTNTLPAIINYAKENQVTIFTIGVGVVDTDVMGQLANETGGQFFIAPNPDQLLSIYQAISDIFDGHYTIRYESSSTANVPILLNLAVDVDGLQGEVSRQFQGCP
jgi:VWFA-related protein